MKLFLAAPFKNKVVNGKISKEYKEMLIGIKKFLEEEGCEIHLALEREKWGEEFWADEACTEKDHAEIRDSEGLIALFDKTISLGMHIELGWASQMKKKILILTKNKENLASLVRGLSKITNIEIVEYKNNKQIKEILKEILERWKN